jgi:hypothetical protein
VDDIREPPFFQFSLGWLFAIVLIAAVWFAVLVYGQRAPPEVSAYS